MFCLRRPTTETIRKILDAQSTLPFTYPEVGASRDAAVPPGYPINHHRIRLGRGTSTYQRAKQALRTWSMYHIPWTTLCWPDAPLERGVTIVVLVRHFGFWSVNPCRIVYVLEESGSVERFGFAIGTLPGHAERGEERFTVELDHTDDSVSYEILTFASGNHPLVKMAHPLLKLLQKRFGRESLQAMCRAVAQSSS